MFISQNIFYKKKILIYGLGKSGISAYRFLKKKSKVYLFDDKKFLTKNLDIKNKLIKYENIGSKNFDQIIISPGININKCRLKSYLQKNFNKIKTDLDIFYSFYKKNKNITITGTNGKSTTAKILYEVLKDQKFDVRLVGNIGNPILLEKNIKNQTIFVIEASSYQIEYSKLFKANFSAILNISPDHLERHLSLTNYVNAKFKLVKNQTKEDFCFLNTKNLLIKKKLEKTKIYSKIIRINQNLDLKFLKKINNSYFLSEGNKENLSFIFEIAKKLYLNEKKLVKSLKNFNGLNYRQQIIHSSKNLTIINDSKATSYSSSISILKTLKHVYWIVGGLPKKGDKFTLKKNDCKNFKVYIFGKNRDIFINHLKNLMFIKNFKTLRSLLKQLSLDVKNEKNKKEKIILFSPSAASFDNFKNFEVRGEYFNKLIKKIFYV